MLSLSKRLDNIEVLANAMSGNLKPAVYGVIDRVDRIDDELVPNVLRCWKGKIGEMIPTDEEPISI